MISITGNQQQNWLMFHHVKDKMMWCQSQLQLTKQFSLLELLIQEGTDLALFLALIILLLGLFGSLLVKNLLLFRALEEPQSAHGNTIKS